MQEGGEFYMDLMMYWDILTPGGILMGDDYMWYWPGVIHDVDLFMKHKACPLAHVVHLEANMKATKRRFSADSALQSVCVGSWPSLRSEGLLRHASRCAGAGRKPVAFLQGLGLLDRQRHVGAAKAVGGHGVHGVGQHVP